MIFTTTALILAGSLFMLGEQTARIATLTAMLHISLWLVVLMCLAGVGYMVHSRPPLGDLV